MKNISFQCLPPIYLVPKKFHCGVLNSCGQEVRISKCANFTRKFNEDSSDTSKISDGEKLSNFENSSIVKYNNNMSKKFLEEKVKANDIIISGNKPAVHIVCKSVQSEKITQYQLITSNKLENYKTSEKNLKWCPIDFYERPKEAFSRNNNINITIKDANLKKNINCKTWFKNDKVLLSTLNIDYQVVQINDDYIKIESVIDLSNNKPFLQLLECCAHEAEWEMILKLVESQLGQNIRNLSIELESFDDKSKLKR